MAQWGRNDQGVTANSTTTKETSNGAPIGTYALVRGGQTGTANVSFDSNAHFGNTSSGSRASVDAAMYGNVTIGAFVANKAVGVFAVNAAMMSTVGGNVVLSYVTSGGSGYQANTANFTPVVTNGGSGASINAVANTTTSAGKITNLDIVTAGSGYITAPSLSNLPAPAAINITANTVGIVNSTLLFSTANSYWQVGDKLTYGVPTGNTAIPGLTGNSVYYVALANTTGVQLAATPGGSVITLTPATTTPGQVHTIQGTTATGYVDVNTDNPAVAHTGWVLRTEGTGGRAGRVFYETLVAMGSIGMNTTSSTGVTGVANTVTSNTVDQYV